MGQINSKETTAESCDSPSVVTTLPWERRKEVGAFRAYWKTVCVVFTSLGSIDRASPGPLTLRSAKAFRRRTVFYVLVTFLLAMLVISVKSEHVDRLLRAAFYDASFFESGQLWVLLAAVMMLVLISMSLGLMSGTITWFMAQRKRDEQSQETALAWGYYMCAAMLLLLAPMIIAVATATLQPGSIGNLSDLNERVLGSVTAKALGALGYVIWYVLALRAIYTAAGRSAIRTTLAAMLLPVAWFAIHIIVAVLPVAAVMWVAMLATLS